jgi:hypothetical protein
VESPALRSYLQAPLLADIGTCVCGGLFVCASVVERVWCVVVQPTGRRLSLPAAPSLQAEC